MRRNDREYLWNGEKTDEATKGDEYAKLRWLDCLTSEVPQSVGVALAVEMNPSLSASFSPSPKLLTGQQFAVATFESDAECVAIVRRRGRVLINVSPITAACEVFLCCGPQT